MKHPNIPYSPMLIISKLQNHNYFKVTRVEERDVVHHDNSIISHKEASIQMRLFFVTYY